MAWTVNCICKKLSNYILTAIQDHWVRSDGAQATREDLMVALSELDYIMIKAEYAKETLDSRLDKNAAYIHNCK